MRHVPHRFWADVGDSLLRFGANRGAPATYTGLVVSVFAIGMLPFGVFYILLRGWYAVEDTRTPFIITVIYNLIAMPLTFLLFTVAPSNLAVCALALAYGLAYWITVGIAWTWLSRRLGGLETGRTLGTVGRMMIAGFFAALVGLFAVAGWAVVIGHAETGDIYGHLTSSQLSALLTLIGGGFVTVLCYLGFATLLRVSEVKSVIGSFAGRLKR